MVEQSGATYHEPTFVPPSIDLGRGPSAASAIASQPIPTRTHFLTSQTLQSALKDLRVIRDQKLYLSEGAPSFRQWAIQLFGERFGIWLDQTLLEPLGKRSIHHSTRPKRKQGNSKN